MRSGRSSQRTVWRPSRVSLPSFHELGPREFFLVTCCMCVAVVVPRSEILELSLVRPCLCQIAGQAGFACRLAASRSNALSRQHSSSRCLQRGKIETRSSHARVITDQQPSTLENIAVNGYCSQWRERMVDTVGESTVFPSFASIKFDSCKSLHC